VRFAEAVEKTSPQEAFPALPSSDIHPNVPYSRQFGDDVQQLGFRIQWSGERPLIQSVDPAGAAHECGVLVDDAIISINGVDSANQSRDSLLPLLKDRPLTLVFLRTSEAAAASATEDIRLDFNKEDATALAMMAHRGTASFGQAASYSFTDSQRVGNSHDTADTFEVEKVFQKTGSMRSTDTLQGGVASTRVGMKKYLEEEETKDSVITKVAKLFTGNGHGNGNEDDVDAESDGPLNKVRKFAIDFAAWWDSLIEPARSGWAYDLLESRAFRFLSAAVIVVNAVVVTWLTDWSLRNSGKNMPPGFELVDLGFLLFYAMEIGLKFYVHGGYFFCNDNSSWNIFDLLLVIFSSFDVAATWPSAHQDDKETPPNNLGYMRVFRMFKFAKILRTIRIISFVRELSMMLESFRQCVIAMFWGLVLLLFLLYVFALVFAQGVASFVATQSLMLDQAELDDFELPLISFGSVWTAMESLYMAVTGGNDWSLYYDACKIMGSFYPGVFLAYTFLFIFALFNILTGVFVERAVAAAMPDREELIAMERKKIMKQVEELRALFKALDTDGSGKLSREEFMHDMQDSRIVSYMHTLGLDMHDAERFFEIVSDKLHDQEVDIDTFIEHCLAMRGTATAMDMHRQMVQVSKVLDKLVAWEEANWPALFAALNEMQKEDILGAAK